MIECRNIPLLEDPAPVQLKGIRNLINLQTPAPFDEFYIPPRGDENPEAGLGTRLELTKEGDVPSGPPVAYFDLEDYDLGDLADINGINGTDFIEQSQDDYIPVVRPNHNGGQYSEGDFFAKRIDLPQYLIIISMFLKHFWLKKSDFVVIISV